MGESRFWKGFLANILEPLLCAHRTSSSRDTEAASWAGMPASLVLQDSDTGLQADRHMIWATGAQLQSLKYFMLLVSSLVLHSVLWSPASWAERSECWLEGVFSLLPLRGLGQQNSSRFAGPFPSRHRRAVSPLSCGLASRQDPQLSRCDLRPLAP